MEPKNVFLSWTGLDKDAKNIVKRYLENREITCLDSEERCVGDFIKWSREAARMDGVFLLFLSKNISSSSVVLQEVEEALNTPNAEKRILPICDDFEIYKTFMGGKLAQRHLSAITAKFKREEGDPEGTKYLEDKLEEIAKKVEIVMETMSFNVYRENSYPKSISLYVGDNMRPVSFDRLYLDRVITEIENGEEKGKITSPKELMEKDGLYFLYGAGGSGKSLYIDQIRKEAGDTLVIDLSCAEVAKRDEPIYDQMYGEVKKHMGGRSYFTDDNFKGMLRSHRLFLVLDGMDELPTKNDKEVFLNKVKEFCDGNHKATGVLFTSRSERDVESVSFGPIRVFRMDKLTKEEIHRLGGNVFLETGSERDQDTFYVRVSDLSDEIRCNPLLLTQLAVIYGESGEVPQNIVGIFDKVRELILRTPINVTPPCEELREENIVGLLKRFAYEKYNHPQTADEKVLAYILKENHPYNAREMAEICLKYLKERSIYVEGKFLHKMLLEYFTAVSYYETIFDDFDEFSNEKKLTELFSHYSDLYWTDMIRLFLIKADNAAEGDALEKLYEEILNGDITEYTMLLDTATKFLSRREIPTEAVCLDLLKKSANGTYPAYGPLFWYIPEYGLYEALVKSAERMKGNGKALALTRDVCCLNGKYTLREVTPLANGEELFIGAKEELCGIRLALCELFCTGKTEEKEEEVYPRLFDVAEMKALMTGGCGIFGRRERVFTDELDLYEPERLPMLGGEYLGFLTLPNDRETAETELKKYSCKKVRAVAFTNTEKETFGYIDFYRRNVKHLYLPENVKELEKYWDNFLTLGRKVFCEEKYVWYRDPNRDLYIIPQGVTEIVEFAFEDCSSLTEIHLPKGLQKIGIYVFYGCNSLTEIHLPDGLQEIDVGVFSGCSSLTEIHLPKGLKTIGNETFKGCSSLREIHLPKELKKIEFSTFLGCNSLTEIHLPEGLQEIGEFAFSGCSSLTAIHLPEGLQKIGEYAFECCNSLTAIHLPDGLTEIGEEAFRNCSGLTEIHLPDGLQEIRKYAFSGCSSLTAIHLPDGLQEIGESAFSGCSSLTAIHLPDGLKVIEGGAFAACSSLTEIHLSNGLQEIGKFAFKDCSSLTKISLPFYVNLKGLPSDVQIEIRGEKKELNRFEVTSYSFPEGIEKIEEKYFKDCKKLVEVRLPESLKEIGNSAFENCSSLREIYLPEGLQNIGAYAFGNCSILREIHLPNGLQEIGKSAFWSCSSLREIHLLEGLQKIGAYAFGDCSSLREIHLPDGLKVIGVGAFSGCNSLTKIHLPKDLKEISGSAFYSCSNLREIHLPEGLQEIGWCAFARCSSLTAIHLPENLKEIGLSVFGDCISLTEIYLPDGLKKIGEFAFWKCSSLREIHLSEGLQEIGWCAFKGCSSLTEIHLPQDLKEIGIETFKGCSSLREIHLPEKLREIGKETFKGCSSLTEIHLPKSVMKIWDEAFKNCTSLRKVVIPRNFETEIERIFGEISPDIFEFID